MPKQGINLMFWSNDESNAFRGDKSQEAQQTNDSDCNYQEDFVLQLHRRTQCTERKAINLSEIEDAGSADCRTIV